MLTSQPISPLPPLKNDDSPTQHQRGSFNSVVAFGGASPVPANRLLEAKAVNLVPRPKTSTSHTRQVSSSASLGLFLASSSPLPSSPNGDQLAPRHGKDMVGQKEFSASDQHHQQPKRVNGASAHGELDRSSSSNNNNKQLSSAAASAAEAVPRWSSSREGHTRSASAPVTAGLASPETAAPSSDQQHHQNTNTHHNNTSNRSRRSDSGRGGNVAPPFSIPRSDSLGSAQSQPRAQTTSSLRRSSSSTSETFSNGGRGFNGGNGTSVTGASVASSNDPNVLKVEINRLQAALMNGFKGGDRFVGGAQFKASISSRNCQHGGSGGGAGGKSCGGCMQVREALRRSRVECRDLRGSLFRAEHIIKQLTLTKAARRRGVNQYGSYAAQLGLHQSSSSPSLAGGATATATAPSEQERRLVPQMLTTSTGCGGEGGRSSSSSRNDGHAGEAPSRENLLSRVQELERELRLADFRDARSMGAAVGEEHSRARKNSMDDEAHLNKSDSDHDANFSPSKSPSSASLRRVPGTTSGAGSSVSSGVWDWGAPPPCSKCSVMNDRLLGEATKVNGLMRRIQEHQEELNRLQGEIVRTSGAHAKAVEMQEKVDALTSQAEGQTRAKEKAWAEIERLVADLERTRIQAAEHEGQARRALEQQQTLRDELFSKESLLEQAATELETARAALESERTSREQTNRTVVALRRKVAEERAGAGKTKGELAAAKVARRHSESQAAAADATHRKALKAALNSCVRLCVVAPTVNINLDERSRSFCSGLPEERIRAFVEESVLPRFTRVLLQPGSEGGSAPPALPSPLASNSSRGRGSGVRAATTKVARSSPAASVSLSSPLNRSSSRSGSDKRKLGVASSPVVMPTAAAAAAVDDPAVDYRESLAQSEDEDKRDVRGGGSGRGAGQGQGDFDKWLRDLLVDMQTSIERHVASVFQTQTAATAATASSIASSGGTSRLRR
ncbi:unnamed protein product [Ectocarpus sp. 13 AM-2016]